MVLSVAVFFSMPKKTVPQTEQQKEIAAKEIAAAAKPKPHPEASSKPGMKKKTP